VSSQPFRTLPDVFSGLFQYSHETDGVVLVANGGDFAGFARLDGRFGCLGIDDCHLVTGAGTADIALAELRQGGAVADEHVRLGLTVALVDGGVPEGVLCPVDDGLAQRLAAAGDGSERPNVEPIGVLDLHHHAQGGRWREEVRDAVLFDDLEGRCGVELPPL